MARYEDEAVRVGDDPLVIGTANVDLVETAGAITLAMERQRRINVLLLGALIDSVVDASEDLFVAGGSLSELHCNCSSALRRGARFCS